MKRRRTFAGFSHPFPWTAQWMSCEIRRQFGESYHPAHVWQKLKQVGHRWPKPGRRGVVSISRPSEGMRHQALTDSHWRKMQERGERVWMHRRVRL